ncbi:MAG: helix-turn-helix domain-containing protein [Spirochaetota bacterium]|jgi:sugar-specific transcriptional regulator TrmB|nr:helix-turn-helix domain-containing protein [Spirochaetota bacterium]
MDAIQPASQIFDSLSKLGLTQNESRIFLYLAQNPGSNGYEISKNTGISRSLVYGALEKMRTNGVIELTQTKSSSYLLKPLQEIRDKVSQGIGQAFDELERQLADMKQLEPDELFVTIQDRMHQRAKLAYMIRSAEKVLFISAGINELEWIRKELQQVPESVAVHIFSLSKLSDFPPHFQLHSKGMEESFIQSLGNLKARWRILMIKDRAEMMLCGGEEQHNGTAIYTKNNMMVTFATEHFVHDVKISNIERNYNITDYTENLFNEYSPENSCGEVGKFD